MGKTSVCRILKKKLENSVFLDGDWCWDMSPFQVTAETKQMVLENIIFLLNRFLHCQAFEHVIFCWVLHEQKIRDDILAGLDTSECRVHNISLVCTEAVLLERLRRDVAQGIRDEDIIGRSLERMPLYSRLDTVKIDVSGFSPEQAAVRIMEMTQ